MKSLLTKADRKLVALGLGVVAFLVLAVTGTIPGEVAIAAITGILSSMGVQMGE